MKTPILLFCAVLAFAQQANADVVIDLIESGGDIVATLSGEINLAATQGFEGTSGGFNGYLDTLGAISITFQRTDLYGLDFNTWTPFGVSGDFENWDSSSGDAWAMFSNPILGVPTGYTSGTALSSTATRNNRTFAGLGWTVGSHVSTFTNGNVSDSVTVNIIPEPGTALLGIMCLSLVGWRRPRGA